MIDPVIIIKSICQSKGNYGEFTNQSFRSKSDKSQSFDYFNTPQIH